MHIVATPSSQARITRPLPSSKLNGESLARLESNSLPDSSVPTSGWPHSTREPRGTRQLRNKAHAQWQVTVSPAAGTREASPLLMISLMKPLPVSC